MKNSKHTLELQSLLGFRLLMDNGASYVPISSKVGNGPQPKKNEIYGVFSQKIGSKVGQPLPKIT